MKFAVSVFLIALLSVTLCFFLPWWTIAIAAFIVSLSIPQQPARSFLAGFTALFILWGGLSLFLSANNDHILAHKVSLLFLKTDSPFMLIIATAFIGALVAGLAALAGSFVRPVLSGVEKHDARLQ